MSIRVSSLAAGLFLPLLLSCSTSPTQVGSSSSPMVPSQELHTILHQFLAADTLNTDPKIYVAFIRPDTVAGQVSIYLQDEYVSNGAIKALPLTAWKVDRKVIFVFTGLEAVAMGGDTTYHHLIRETARANKDKIWSPPFRGWRVNVQDQRVVRVNRQLSFAASLGFQRFATPPPPPVLSPSTTPTL